jgi:hypothetical protein
MGIFAVEPAVRSLEKIAVCIRVVEVQVYAVQVTVLGFGFVPEVRIEVRFAPVIPCDGGVHLFMMVGYGEQVSVGDAQLFYFLHVVIDL